MVPTLSIGVVVTALALTKAKVAAQVDGTLQNIHLKSKRPAIASENMFALFSPTLPARLRPETESNAVFEASASPPSRTTQPPPA